MQSTTPQTTTMNRVTPRDVGGAAVGQPSPDETRVLWRSTHPTDDRRNGHENAMPGSTQAPSPSRTTTTYELSFASWLLTGTKPKPNDDET
ncbi:hypothetical protein Y032_0031g2286 [Ancylostoma ceylanicum]|uniref:Uncharacterized protein n=1 Tax=Ancylostoma ceylanicum TaxID=53326 RepID=A0A016URJ8_9BILA|nr:hypothetical protein Y032_0031g2286 [Ancylostoma ceylanicum]